MLVLLVWFGFYFHLLVVAAVFQQRRAVGGIQNLQKKSFMTLFAVVWQVDSTPTCGFVFASCIKKARSSSMSSEPTVLRMSRMSRMLRMLRMSSILRMTSMTTVRTILQLATSRPQSAEKRRKEWSWRPNCKVGKVPKTQVFRTRPFCRVGKTTARWRKLKMF